MTPPKNLAAVVGTGIESGNPIRNESLAEAVELDARLSARWSRHPRVILFPSNRSFFDKIGVGLAALEACCAK